MLSAMLGLCATVVKQLPLSGQHSPEPDRNVAAKGQHGFVNDEAELEQPLRCFAFDNLLPEVESCFKLPDSVAHSWTHNRLL